MSLLLLYLFSLPLWRLNNFIYKDTRSQPWPDEKFLTELQVWLHPGPFHNYVIAQTASNSPTEEAWHRQTKEERSSALVEEENSVNLKKIIIQKYVQLLFLCAPYFIGQPCYARGLRLFPLLAVRWNDSATILMTCPLLGISPGTKKDLFLVSLVFFCYFFLVLWTGSPKGAQSDESPLPFSAHQTIIWLISCNWWCLPRWITVEAWGISELGKPKLWNLSFSGGKKKFTFASDVLWNSHSNFSCFAFALSAVWRL